MITLVCNTAFAAFEKSSNLPSIMVAEVRGYGENELLPKFSEDFKDILSSELSLTQKFNVDMSRIGVDLENPTPEDELFSTIHMNAIANGHLYRRDLANAKMIRYGDSVKGREYYQNNEITAQRMKLEGKPYRLSFEVEEAVKEIGNTYGVDYLLFVNLRDADVWRKHGGIFGTHTTAQEFRGKKASIDLEFYLINTKTGSVFEGQNSEKKTSLVTNILISKYGNNFTIQEMMQNLMATQAQQIIKIINKQAF